MAVRSNIRVASAACRSFQEAIAVGLRAGAFSGVLVVSMAPWSASVGWEENGWDGMMEWAKNGLIISNHGFIVLIINN